MLYKAMKTGAKKLASGFTLMELLIAIAIVAILAVVAIPTYIHYTKKAYFSEVVTAADALKVAVAACLDERGGTVTDCVNGAFGIPNAQTASGDMIASVTVTGNAVITATAQNKHGITGDTTYILTPAWDNLTGVTWTVGGTGCTQQLISCAAAPPP